MAAASASSAAPAGGFLRESSLEGKDLTTFNVLTHGFKAFGTGRNTGLPEEILYAMYISIVHCENKDIFNGFMTDISNGDKGEFLSKYKNEGQKIRDLKKLNIGLLQLYILILK